MSHIPESQLPNPPFSVFSRKFYKIFDNSFPKDIGTTHSHYSDNSAWKLLSFCQDQRIVYKATPQKEGIGSRHFPVCEVE